MPVERGGALARADAAALLAEVSIEFGTAPRRAATSEQCYAFPRAGADAAAKGDPDALVARAEAVLRTDPSAALEFYRAAIEAAPQRIGWWLAVAKLALELNRLDEAIEGAEQVLRAHPGQAEASVLLASALLRRRDFARMAQVLAAAPKNGPQAANFANLTGAMLLQQGRIHEGLAATRPIKRLAPRSATLQMSRVMSLNYDPELSRGALFEEHLWFGKAFADAVAPVTGTEAPRRDPHRRLRIGYLSPDFRTHSVAYFVAPIFEAFDRDQFETIAYAHVPRPDNVTEHLRSLASAWRDVTPLDDAQLAQLIRDDRIDILVELAGLTRHSRLLACTARPAPIQMSYLGYPNTTGLPQIDYRITDHIADGDDADDFHTETLIRLPRCFLAFAAPDHAPEIEPPPVQRNGHVTFGSFNNLAKVNRKVVALWAEVLRAVPGSRLLLKASGSGDPTAQRHLRDAFERAGVAPERIRFADYASSARGHLEVY
ncbi:MAG TPA: hypothetical protein VK001_04895, partial [Geminicoccaceae bacterium]|nr:hypothetical protein [Geminicoccaceae bacterium]